VPFGEFVPFRNARVLGMSLHWLYRWLNRLSPFSQGGRLEYSLWPGGQYTVFDLDIDGKTTRFGVPICYEDVMPYVMRNFVWEGGRRRVDFLVNISNDGWFLHSDELPQHLAICVFRAVENRVGIARAVNTGISGFIDPSGHIYSLVEQDGRAHGPGVVGYRVAAVKLDQRSAFYGRRGDWFVLLCVLGTLALWMGAVVTRWVFALRKRMVTRRARGR
jgi:apolipoprotein N-acyltransferase